MIFNVLTIFPDIFAPVETGVVGRAAESGLLEINKVNIREFSANKHKNTDDYPYGGGEGMLMTVQPVVDAWKSIKKPGKTILLSPRGSVLDQKKCIELSKCESITLVCGRYEGLDERIFELIADEQLSVGDYVLSGGEIAAMTIIDSVARHIPGVLGNAKGNKNDSHYDGLLECPQYTRPEIYEDMKVPEVLLSGNHAKINEFRLRESLKLTWKLRPDMIRKRGLCKKEAEILEEEYPEDREIIKELISER